MSDESSSSSSSPILNPFKSAQSTVQPKSDQMNQQQLFEYQMKQQKRPQNLVIKREFKNAIIQTGQINVQTSASFLRDVVIPTVHKSLQTDEINLSESNEQKIQTDNYNKNNETNIKEKDSFKEQEQKMIQREQMMLKEQMNQIENKMNQNEVNSFKETDYHQQEDQMKENENVLTKNEQINEINVEQLDQMNKIDTNLKEQHNQQMKQSQNIQTDQERKKMMNQIEENAIQIKQKIQNTIKMEQIDSQKNIIETSQNEQTKENLQENKTHESAIQDEPKMYFEKDDNSTNKQTKITYQKELVVQNKMDKHLEKETNVEESDIKISISENSDDKQTQIDKYSERQQDKEESEINISISDSEESKQNEQSNQIMETQKIEQELNDENQSQKTWFYIDSKKIRQGPFTSAQMNTWNLRQKLPLGLKIQQGLGEFFTLKREHINLSNFFQDKVIQDSRQYECILAHAETQTGLNDLEISVTQTRLYFSKLVIPPSVEKCINTELSLRRGNQDELFVENTFNIFKDVQAVQVGVSETGVRIPVIKKEQKDQKQSIFAPEASDLKQIENPDLNPEKQKNETKQPQTNKVFDQDYFGDDFYNYDLINSPTSIHFQSQSEQPHGNHNRELTSTQTNNQHINATQSQYVENKIIQSNEQNSNYNIQCNLSYRYYDESDHSEDQQLAQPEQVTNPHTDSKNWSESQWTAFKTKILKAIIQYFNIEFQTLEEALIYYRKCIVGAENGKATKIHLNFKKIASDCDITEKECRQKFQTLLGNQLQSWPEEVIAEVNERILKLQKEIQEPDIAKRKDQIRDIIELEFHLKQQVQYRYKEISNKIDYILRKLK
ncbi:GYF_domain [Hexamita inflata]|uniref:GYF domain n=1 Tax=Hexamita inflata TaxID=28002 RepID=A0AA86N714_9EUKA|nr:GYF domain [Hexamita inflata]